MKKNCKRQINKKFRIEKVIKKKGDKLYVKWKGYDSSFNSLIKQAWFHQLQFHCITVSQYFPKPYEPFGRDINVKVNLSNYATKADIKNISHIDMSSFANFCLKTEVYKLDINELVPVPVDLSKLSDAVVKNDVVKSCIW